MKRTLNSNENTRLVTWLKAMRKEQGLTTDELGKLLNTPHTFVSKVERQERRLDVIEYLAYCRALKADPTEGLRTASNKPKSWPAKS